MTFEGPFQSRITGFPSLHKTGAQGSSLLFISYMKGIELALCLANLEEMMLKGKHIWIHGTFNGDFFLSLCPWSRSTWKCVKLYCVKRQKTLMLQMPINPLDVAKPSGHGIVKSCLFSVQSKKVLVFLHSLFCLENERDFIPTCKPSREGTRSCPAPSLLMITGRREMLLFPHLLSFELSA